MKENIYGPTHWTRNIGGPVTIWARCKAKPIIIIGPKNTMGLENQWAHENCGPVEHAGPRQLCELYSSPATNTLM